MWRGLRKFKNESKHKSTERAGHPNSQPLNLIVLHCMHYTLYLPHVSQEKIFFTVGNHPAQYMYKYMYLRVVIGVRV